LAKVIFHLDLDAFFAAVETLDHPEYAGKPLIVGGDPGGRGVVSTCNYEARKFGIHSAMPTFRAHKLCPQGIFVHPNMQRYQEKSKEVMDIFESYTPDIKQVSIDEAYLDMTGTQRLLGAPDEVALRLKEEVKGTTGLTISVGVAPTIFWPKSPRTVTSPMA
jgi:DNA polymerase-4